MYFYLCGGVIYLVGRVIDYVKVVFFVYDCKWFVYYVFFGKVFGLGNSGVVVVFVSVLYYFKVLSKLLF